MANLKSISREAVLQAVAEFDRVGRAKFLDTHGFGEAREYFLVIDGKRYDSKAILGVAFGYQHPGARLRASDFSGGEATVQSQLEDLDFKVEWAGQEKKPQP